MQIFTANKPPTGGNGMSLRTCIVRGKPMWVLETYNGHRKRQFFKTQSECESARAAAAKHQRELGTAWEILSAREKARILVILGEIEQAGMTLEGVWKAVQAIPNAPRASRTLGKAIQDVLAAKKESNCRTRHIGNLKWYLKKFAKGREETPVSAIGLRDLEDWFAGRQESPRAKRGHISLLSTLFEYCWRKRYISENPVKRLEPVHIDRKTPSVFTARQCAKALLFCVRRRPKLLGWLTLALFCGLRPDSEADFISWDDIDLDRKRLVIERSKVRQVAHRIADLSFSPPAVAWLTVAKAIGAALPIHFESRRRGIRALRKYLKLKRWPQDVLRHTAASNLFAFHQDAGKVAAFMGNSAGVLIRDYKALVFKEDAVKFMNLLPKERHYKKWAIRIK